MCWFSFWSLPEGSVNISKAQGNIWRTLGVPTVTTNPENRSEQGGFFFFPFGYPAGIFRFTVLCFKAGCKSSRSVLSCWGWHGDKRSWSEHPLVSGNYFILALQKPVDRAAGASTACGVQRHISSIVHKCNIFVTYIKKVQPAGGRATPRFFLDESLWVAKEDMCSPLSVSLFVCL